MCDGNVTKTIDYSFGHDEISQTVTLADGTSTTHAFGHDGHGSVRVLYDLAASIVQTFTFSAFGEMLAVHDGAGNFVGDSETDALTSLGYSGEHFDAFAQQQYLRARYYNPANAQFNRLDPFFGNMQDPQSLHKYAYVHGDPVNGTDPTGEFLVSVVVSLAVGGFNRAKDAAASFSARETALLGLTTALGTISGALTYLSLGRSITKGAVFGGQLGFGAYSASSR